MLKLVYFFLLLGILFRTIYIVSNDFRWTNLVQKLSTDFYLEVSLANHEHHFIRHSEISLKALRTLI